MESENTFSSVLDAADALSVEEQETLIDVLSHRVADANRRRLYAEVQDARREFAEGKCQPANVDALMQELLA
jgi:hypothetical protein